jgi:flagellar protein FlgJ
MAETPTYAAGRTHVLPAAMTGRDAPAGTPRAIARRSAEDFEAVFLQTMVGEMMAGLGKEGPLGEGEAGGAWRGLLVQEYAGAIAKSGGLGIADALYPQILALQSGSLG